MLWVYYWWTKIFGKDFLLNVEAHGVCNRIYTKRQGILSDSIDMVKVGHVKRLRSILRGHFYYIRLVRILEHDIYLVTNKEQFDELRRKI